MSYCTMAFERILLSPRDNIGHEVGVFLTLSAGESPVSHRSDSPESQMFQALSPHW